MTPEKRDLFDDVGSLLERVNRLGYPASVGKRYIILAGTLFKKKKIKICQIEYVLGLYQ